MYVWKFIRGFKELFFVETFYASTFNEKNRIKQHF